MAMLFMMLILLSIRIYILQIYPSEKVQSSYKNHQEENITNLDYMILDSKGRDMMKYAKKYILVIDLKPFSLNNYEETLEDLMALNFIMKSEDPEFNYSEIMKQTGKMYYDISKETYEKINKLTNLKGIYTYISDTVDVKKAWSIGNMFGKIMEGNHKEGTIEYELYEYLKDNETPKEEFYLDDKAIYSKQSINISDKNRNLRLTIDKDMQNKVNDVLEDEQYDYLENIGIIIMESETGKIRCMIQKDESEANINLGIEQMGYEPGSIYKIVTLGSALDCGLINIDDIYCCNGNICRVPHGRITVEKAFEISCNDVFAQIGAKLGYDKLMEYSKSQGLYNPVINFAGNNCNEAAGVIPNEEAGINNISIGQCMNVTPVQMIGAINTIVNNGVYIKPYIVEAVLDKNENIVKEFEGEKKRVYSEITAKLVQNSMKKVVQNGTGKKAYINSISIGGKTGSSTGNNGKTHGWFVGYFNMEDKKYTMIVFTPNIECVKDANNNDAGGGDTAAPIFKSIVEKLYDK
ncbi:penicillin-binding protein 2 [uncultured Clostridium sp.]|uniref:peptidoglycan D,D-transpeptidase FtsI family protein n=1 Tax=uncultured Clostridium sp. TaxID=59620 RepID=UPI0025DF4D0D|nr:penicillin-binding transpeptidase domain-containing protein [uncultured Clostridium sp.]